MSAQAFAVPEHVFDLDRAMKSWPGVPASVLMSLKLYTEQRLGPGAFLRAILENDLRGAVEHSNSREGANLYAIVSVVYWFVPHVAWGSRQRVHDWLHRKEQV